ncbi:Do family serine endopeptidase [Pelagibacteraceae bacterium]|nr:Do family serine endopeptidase [Pelagibacteraceae bacterium]
MIKRYFIFPLSLFLYLNGIIITFAFTGPDTFSDLAESVSPSVVNISTTGVIEQTGPEVPSIEDFFNFPFNMPRSEPSEREFSSLGSGFVISEDGFIVTNNHVVENASDIQVTFTDGTKIEAELIAADAETDLALLKVDTNNLDYLEFGDSDTAKVGNWVMAIGNPHGLGGTVTAGIVSARGRMLGGRYDDFIQTDASINRGNSGGPLFDLDGKVIGVNSMIISPSGGSIGIGFAIPSNLAKNIIDQLKDTGEIERAWLGVRIQEVTEEIAQSLGLTKTYGALVQGLTPDSPALSGGVKEGDIIIEFNGKEVESVQTLPKLVAEANIGEQSTVVVWRDEKEVLLNVNLGKQPSLEELASIENNGSSINVAELGIKIRSISDEDKDRLQLPSTQQGVVISEIDNDSFLIRQNIKKDDIIIEIQNKVVSSTGEKFEN